MDNSAKILELADEIERFEPIPSTFKRQTPLDAAKLTLRFCAELIRDRVSGDTSRDREATPEQLAELSGASNGS